MASFRSHTTPNPNSIKITANRGDFIPTGLLSFSSQEEASSHPLGAALFDLDGISNVLILPGFLTVTKTPEFSWAELWPEIEQVLQRLAR